MTCTGQQNDDGWQQRAAMALSAAAAAERLVTYAELADAAGITGKHRINRLTAWLEAGFRLRGFSSNVLNSASTTGRPKAPRRWLSI